MSERPKPNMSEMMHRVVEQTDQKKLWVDNDTPEVVADMIVEEGRELIEAIQESMLSGDVFNVASEIGDVLYLSLKLCSLLGLVPEDVVKLKILRNDLKYPNDLNSHGNYETQRRRSKDMWTAMGGDTAFSHAYLDVFSELEDEEEVNPFAIALSQNGNGHVSHEALELETVQIYKRE